MTAKNASGPLQTFPGVPGGPGGSHPPGAPHPPPPGGCGAGPGPVKTADSYLTGDLAPAEPVAVWSINTRKRRGHLVWSFRDHRLASPTAITDNTDRGFSMRHTFQTLFLIVFVFLTGSGMAYPQSSGCTGEPNETGAPGSFIYNGGGTTDLAGNVTCFDASSGTWKTVTTEYGQFQVQTLADQWPDGDVIAQPDGTEYRSMAVYEGFRRVVTNDAVNFATLDPISRIARHSAPAVVEVFGDRCLQYIPASYGVPASGTWDIGVKPFSGFFVNSSTIVTAAGVSNKIAFDPEAGSWGAGGYGQSQQSCSELEAMGPTTTSWEQGAGPFVRLFDGRWASGSIVASNDNVAVIRLERVTSDGDTLVSTWAPWNPALAPGDPLRFRLLERCLVPSLRSITQRKAASAADGISPLDRWSLVMRSASRINRSKSA